MSSKNQRVENSEGVSDESVTSDLIVLGLSFKARPSVYQTISIIKLTGQIYWFFLWLKIFPDLPVVFTFKRI